MAKSKLVKKQRWQKQRDARIRFYAKAVKITRKELKKAGVEISYNSARKFTSQYVYVRFKGLPTSKIKASEISKVADEAINSGLTSVPLAPKAVEFIDPRAISEIDITDIMYWELNDYLTGAADYNIYQARALKGMNYGKNLRFEIIGGPDNRTGQLTLLEYDGVLSGVIPLIEGIREEVNNQSGPYFVGSVGTRSGMTDPANPDTYILQFILYVDDQPVVPPDTTVTMLPQQTMTQAEYEEYKRNLASKIGRQDEIDARKEEALKSRARKTAKRPTKKKQVKEPIAPQEPAKKEPKSRGDRVLELNKQKIRELEMLRKDLDDKIISKKEYKADRDRLMKQYEDALKKMKRGGEI